MSTSIAGPVPIDVAVTPKQRLVNAPKFSIIAAVLLIALAITAIVIGSYTHTDITPIMGFIALAIPTLLSSAYSERNSNDMRNGVISAKANQGTIAALHSTGLVDAAVSIAESKGSTNLAMQALSRLLELNTTASNANTTATNTNTAGQLTDTAIQNVSNHSPAQIIPIPQLGSIIVAPPNTANPSPVQTFTPQVESAGGKTNG